MKNKYDIGQFMVESDRKTTAEVLISSSKDFRSGLISGRSCNKCQIIAIVDCRHQDGSICRQIRNVPTDTIPPHAKGLVFMGEESDSDHWHICTQEISVYQPASINLDILDGINVEDYDALRSSDVYDQFPDDDEILSHIND